MAHLEELLPQFRQGAKIRLSTWPKGKFIIHSNGGIFTNDDYDYPLSIGETLSNYWELYQEPIDWDYVVQNKCLCWFWDDELEMKKAGLLTTIDRDDEYPFEDDNDTGFENCCPIRRDEVTFYEDKRSEQK